MIIVNFKNYVYGERALERAKLVERYLPRAVLAVSAFDLREIASKTNLKVYAQHLDFQESERATGFLIPSIAKKLGARGTLLNHSEHRIPFEQIRKTLKVLRACKLRAVVCAASVREAMRLAKLKPYAIAYEEPALIASGKSITSVKSSEVARFAAKLAQADPSIKRVCGAGINSADDVRAAKQLGCNGVLIASALAKVPSKKAEKLLRELAKV